jgi:acetyltransferase
MTRYCNIDYDRENAIIAELQQDDKKIIGAVRLILEPDMKTGEFAILVGDQWQGQGLGLKLMENLFQLGKDMRVDSIYGYVTVENEKMLRLMEKLGFKTQKIDGETFKVHYTMPK